jgi:hypothetical protein
MRATIADGILIINKEDLPSYKQGGSIVRNSYFWALRSIACYAPREGDWEFDQGVWVALGRMLMTFTQSGYLKFSETSLEIKTDQPIPEELRVIATYC